ncbi:MAG: hypothetical protein ABJF11_02020 [Reichenbachiella sp.]|uniref:hypothetical protein n=1 Tax=Reichenbachiella sp. TaxID=2184521 RepID=UPI00326451B5
MKIFPMLFIILLTFFSCEEAALNSQSDTNRVVISQEQFDTAWADLQSEESDSDPFQLNSLMFDGTKLMVNVSYSGGCKPHDFQLIWPESMMLIMPPRYTVILMHDANDDSCEAYLTETLTFDLAALDLGITEEVIDQMDFTLINGSDGDQSLKLIH